MWDRLRRIIDIPIGIIDVVLLLAAAATIIQTVFFVSATLKESDYQTVPVPIIVIGLAVIILLIITYKMSLLSRQRLTIFSKSYHEAVKTLFDSYYSVIQISSKNQLNVETFKVMLNELPLCLNLLCDVMTIATGKKVSACIKILVDENGDFVMKKNVQWTEENAYQKTLCRDSKSSTNRADHDGAIRLVKGDSDFSEILFEKKPKFFAANLSKTPNYVNSTRDYEKYYRGTIVVPLSQDIRQHASSVGKTRTDKMIFGFLCIDSLSTSAFAKFLFTP